MACVAALRRRYEPYGPLRRRIRRRPDGKLRMAGPAAELNLSGAVVGIDAMVRRKATTRRRAGYHQRPERKERWTVLECVQRHWRIEIRLRWLLDVRF